VEIAANVEHWDQVAAPPLESDAADRLTRVFRSVCDGLYRFILVRVHGDRETADELLQQTCHEAAKSQAMPTDVDECQAWLHGVARNLIRRHWRKANRSRVIEAADGSEAARQLAEAMESGPLPPEVLDRKETAQQILLAVTALPAESQRLVFAVYFEDRCQADVAHELGMTEKSVEMRLYRIRERLRTTLKDIDRL